MTFLLRDFGIPLQTHTHTIVNTDTTLFLYWYSLPAISKPGVACPAFVLRMF